MVELIRKNLFRSIKYSLSGYLGFFVLEIVTYLGLRLLGYSRIVEIDAVAFFTGVSLEFLVNEYWTTRNEGFHESSLRGIFYQAWEIPGFEPAWKYNSNIYSAFSVAFLWYLSTAGEHNRFSYSLSV